LIALDARTGDRRFSTALGFPVLTGLAVGQGRAANEVWVSGSGRHGSTGLDGDVCDGHDAVVRAVDTATGRLSSTPAATPTFGSGSNTNGPTSAVVDGMRVEMIGGREIGKPAAFEGIDATTGRVLWRHAGGIGEYTSVEADAHAAYVMKLGGPVTAFDPRTGHVLWHSTAWLPVLERLEHAHHPWSTIAGIDSGVIVVIDRYAVVAIDTRDGIVRWTWSGRDLPYVVESFDGSVYIAQYGVACAWED
jgi:hypothetical protein